MLTIYNWVDQLKYNCGMQSQVTSFVLTVVRDCLKKLRDWMQVRWESREISTFCVTFCCTTLHNYVIILDYALRRSVGTELKWWLKTIRSVFFGITLLRKQLNSQKRETTLRNCILGQSLHMILCCTVEHVYIIDMHLEEQRYIIIRGLCWGIVVLYTRTVYLSAGLSEQS